ncbi:helix-turn-helix domain-containing protein [Streptomyces spirodelae]|uniref:AraC family transcriptional regulator n=1 Tax=Streptomyces spirodelae TaxID=2812904 RepID=A0ABS3WMD6_9ACTN|nr:AraC family transcriptional regulator [Streptomyces spirodelae]MBO8184270.1 AraC family transcriptional regulator [Streptomyces spirodelae]
MAGHSDRGEGATAGWKVPGDADETGGTRPRSPEGGARPRRDTSGAGPRRDTRGIVLAPDLLARVRFRRRLPAEPLRRWVEHYWLIDWDLQEPYVSQVVPHPCVNLVFERRGPAGLAPVTGLVAEVGTGVFTTKLEGTGRVCGVQFRPGGFRPFLAPPRPLATLTGRHLPLDEAFGTGGEATSRVLGPDLEDDRVAALDAFLLSLSPAPDPAADRAMALAHRVRTDRSVLRVERLAADAGMSVRTLQRLFGTYVGVTPKWTILRYRVHETMEHATAHPGTDWARLAAELGYSDQAHLVRDFTAAVGVTPSAYARAAAQAAPAGDVERGPGDEETVPGRAPS